MVLKILFKRFEHKMNLENGKEFPFLPPSLGLGQFFLSSPVALLPPPPFFSASAQAPAWPSSPRPRASPSPQPLTGRPRAPASLPHGARRSEPSPTLSPSRTRSVRTKSRAILASYPVSARLLPFIYRPDAPQLPISTRASAAASKLAEIRCRNPHHSQSAAAAPSSLCEQLAELRLRRAKSPRSPFRALLLCALA